MWIKLHAHLLEKVAWYISMHEHASTYWQHTAILQEADCTNDSQ